MKHWPDIIKCICATGVVLLSLSSCDSIYDDPSEIPSTVTEFGLYENVDATDYKQWVYLNLEDSTQTTLSYDNTADIPSQWHLALHRYDLKTNGGSACQTAYTSLEDLRTDLENGSFALPALSEFAADEDGKITIDMSHMMEGWLDYADAQLNKVLGTWLDVDTSNMPPNYTMGDKVYLVRMADGTVAAIKFTGYSNPYKSNTKGYISFTYIYPLDI